MAQEQSEEVIDVTALTEAKSDQINADDLVSGAIRVRIEDVRMRNTAEQKLEIKLSGHQKVWRPCKTTTRIMTAGWGANAAKWRGECLELYNDPDVTWGGACVGGIRISAMSSCSVSVSLNATKKSKAKHEIRRFTAAEVAAIGGVDNGKHVKVQTAGGVPLKPASEADDLADFRDAISNLVAERVVTKAMVRRLLDDGKYAKLDDVPPDMRRAFYDALATPVEEEAPAK